MNADNDKQNELQRMLALKRHEAPPPRFFRGFSHQVIDRLHAPEPSVSQTWWQKLGSDLESKPVLVCGSGIVVCGLLIVGLIVSLRVNPPRPAAADPSLLVVSPTGASFLEPIPPVTPPGESLRVGDPVLISEPSPFLRVESATGIAGKRPPEKAVSNRP